MKEKLFVVLYLLNILVSIRSIIDFGTGGFISLVVSVVLISLEIWIYISSLKLALVSRLKLIRTLLVIQIMMSIITILALNMEMFANAIASIYFLAFLIDLFVLSSWFGFTAILKPNHLLLIIIVFNIVGISYLQYNISYRKNN